VVAAGFVFLASMYVMVLGGQNGAKPRAPADPTEQQPAPMVSMTQNTPNHPQIGP
jgi:hypothetical protein